MLKLALPGVAMLEAEGLAFAILTLSAARFGTTSLAAQSVLSTLTTLALQIPFSLSIAGSTRIVNHISAAYPIRAKISARVTFSAALIAGAMNMTLLFSLQEYMPHLFTADPEVIQVISDTLPLVATFQLFDALATTCNGVLRGLGRQSTGGYVQLICYYLIGMPISFSAGFGLHLGLYGLWTGVAVALALVGLIEGLYICKLDWIRCVEEAQRRNEDGGL